MAYLDGLRGVAAAVVVLEHLSAFLPLGLGDNPPWPAWGYLFRSGTFSVYVFFVMSGLAIAASAQGNRVWLPVVAKRYCRLTIPMVAALSLAAGLFGLFPDQMPLVYAYHPNHWTGYAAPAPSLAAAISNALWGEYLFGDHSIDSVLWSMRVELIGSIGVYTLFVFTPERRRLQALAAIAVALVAFGQVIYLGFPIGSAIFLLRDRLVTRPWWVALGLVGLGVLFGIEGRFHRPQTFMSIGATMIVIGVMVSPAIKAALTSKLPRFLGRISYSVYLIHLPILYSVGAAWFLALGHDPDPVRLTAWLSAVLGIVIGVSWAMTIMIDEPVARIFAVRKGAIRAAIGRNDRISGIASPLTVEPLSGR